LFYAILIAINIFFFILFMGSIAALVANG